MGAFILYSREELAGPGGDERVKRACRIFSDIGLTFSGEFDLGDYTLALYSRNSREVNYVISGADFIAVTGSLVYRGKTGAAAGELLLKDISQREVPVTSCRGHFCVIARKGGELILFRDSLGLYPVYQTPDLKMVSSSLLATACLMPKVIVSPEQLYEYLFNGFWYGSDTIIKNITLLPGDRWFYPGRGTEIIYNAPFTDLSNASYNNIIDHIAFSVREQMDLIGKAFQGKLSIGMSGGYDSRLLLSAYENLGYKPDQFVYGTDNSTDVIIAKKLGDITGRTARHIHAEYFYPYDTEGKLERLKERFLRFDGLGSGGVFDNYSDFDYRMCDEQFRGAVLSGAGGEIYRESFNIPDRKITLSAFVTGRYDKFDFNSIMKRGNAVSYLDYMEDTFARFLNKRGKISRYDIERLHLIRHKAIHFIAGWQQYFNPFILPFHESHMMHEAASIPMKYKNSMRLNQDLISRFSPLLAKAGSAYGYSFAAPVPLKYRTVNAIKRNVPLKVRPLLRKYIKEGRSVADYTGNSYLAPGVLDRLFGNGTGLIDEYVNIDHIGKGILLSRTLSVELFLRFLNEGCETNNIFR